MEQEQGSNRSKAKVFTDLIVWQKSHRLVLNIYKATESFPGRETYGLSSQLRSAAISIPANIAEGFKRRGIQDKKRFLNISQSSLEECRYYLILSQDLGYLEKNDLMNLLEEVSKLLAAYLRSMLNSGK